MDVEAFRVALAAARTPEAGRHVIATMTVPELRELARLVGVRFHSSTTKQMLRDRIVDEAVGRRLDG